MKLGIYPKNQMTNLQKQGWVLVEEIDDEFIKMQRDDTLSQIIQLKNYLISTDFQAIKYAEDEMTEEEYRPIKEERRKARLKINELEEKIPGLKLKGGDLDVEL